MTDSIHSALAQLTRGLRDRDRTLVNDAARTLLAARAPLGRQWQPVSAALAHNGEVDLAIAAVNELVAAAGNSPTARFSRAILLAQSGRPAEAEAELASLPTTIPDPVANAYLRGTLALNLGDRAAANAHLRRGVALRPSSGQAWLTLAELTDFRTDSDLRHQLEQAWSDPPEDLIERANLGHAVGRMRDQCGDYAGAFEAFAAGASARRQIAPPPQNPRMVTDSLAWPRDLIARAASRVTVDHGRAIFVTSLPRSGSTLVEQILVSHPDVGKGEELGLFRIIAQEIGGLDAASFAAWLDRGGEPDQLVSLYLHLASQRLGGEGRLVDKTLEASGYMGLLLALFPQAPILWVRRDPIDCGWSAFRTYFVRGLAWSQDLADVGRRLADEDRLFEHWTREWPDRLTVVDYEALVRSPRDQIEHIAAAAGLTPDEAMFAPHETERSVTTASVSQVREPINLKGLGVADPYRQWLGPMIDAYRAAGSVTPGSD